METYCAEKKMVPASRGGPCLSLRVCLDTEGQRKREKLISAFSLALSRRKARQAERGL